jgi:hypothetical protein
MVLASSNRVRTRAARGVRVRLIALLVSGLGPLLMPQAAPGEPAWQTLKAKHFVICSLDDAAFAGEVGRQAEQYYDEIAANLGYTRRDNFWLWDHRVRILIYRTRADFVAACQAPVWAAGKASYERREIATYQQSGEKFLANLLPHELTHLMFKDFVGARTRVPRWVEEGVAQWQQTDRGLHGDISLSQMAAAGRLIPLRQLTEINVSAATDEALARLYYAQAASVVGYLIRVHGQDRFARWCRLLRDGKTPAEALRQIYPATVPDVEALEAAWIKHIQGGLP